MTFALARSLLLADALKSPALAEALLLAGTRGTSLIVALLASGAIDPSRLEQYLEAGSVPYVRHVTPMLPLIAQLPPELCERLFALPIRADPRTGTVDVAIVDARDVHPVHEMAHWLRAPVRMVRTSLASMEAGLRQLRVRTGGTLRSLAPPMSVPPTDVPPTHRTPTFPPPGAEIAGEDGKAGELAQNIPFALTRKTAPGGLRVMSQALEDREPSNEPVTDPVLDLFRRKHPGDPAPSWEDLPAMTARGPYSSVGPSTPSVWTESVASSRAADTTDDLQATLDAMQIASERDAVLALVLGAMGHVARRVAVFAVKRNGIVGWTCSSETASPSEIRALRIEPATGTALEMALHNEGAVRISIPEDPSYAPLRTLMRLRPIADGPSELGMVAFRVEGKPAAVLVATASGDSEALMNRMQSLARPAGDALARVLRAQRK